MHEVCSVPLWIKLENLDLKFWGEKSLFKIAGKIGKPIQVDSFTRQRTRLAYPRILIIVQLTQKLAEEIQFMDENGDMKIVGVTYEWKPTLCEHCKGLGHSTEECKKREPRKAEWVAKKKPEPKQKEEKDAEGFTKVHRGSVPKGKAVVEAPVVMNSFTVLDEGMEIGEPSGEGGDPSLVNG